MLKALIAFLLYGLAMPPLLAQTADLSTPRKSVYNHLWYLQKEQYLPQLAARSLGKVPTALPKAERLAIQLKQVYDGMGLYINLDQLPDRADFADSASRQHKVVPHAGLPQVFLVKVGHQWVYAPECLPLIPSLHEKVYPWGLHGAMNLVPAAWRMDFWGLHTGQYLGLLFIVLASLLIHRLLLAMLRRVIIIILKRIEKTYVASNVLRTVAKPLSWLIITQFIILVVPALMLPIGMSKWVLLVLKSLAPLFATVVFYNLVAVMAEFFKQRAKRTEGTLDDQLVPLVSKVARLVVILVGAGYILWGMGVDVRPYVLGISFGGIALALAAQDTVKNLFRSAVIFLDRPFQIGDWINYNGVDGTVEEVGLRSTRLRTFYHSVVAIPNGKLADTHVDNYGLRVYRRFKTNLSITYDTPTERIELFVDGLRQLVLSHPHTRKDYYEVHLNDLGPASIDVLFYIFFVSANWTDELKARHEILMGILNLARALGVRFAFPTQTLHIEEMPGQAPLTPANDRNIDELKHAREAFIAMWKSKLAN
jgi:MscS family membrane protein